MSVQTTIPPRAKNSSTVKRFTIAVMGGTVLLVGVALVFLPGPAFIVIPAGLAILATEFAWAERWLVKAKEFYRKQRDRVKSKFK